jgi:RNA 2',3'-cyclic 3'-phosphodiesterase
VERVRSFIAIELPEEVRATLSQLETQLMAESSTAVKWVATDSIHLTLKFLGSVDSDKLDAIIRAMQIAASGISPFQLELNALGVFPNTRQVQVVWVGLDGELASLTRLQKSIEANVSPLGFPTEARPFRPHLTLARVREQALPSERQKLGDLIASRSLAEPSAFEVSSISLMRSQLTRQGAIYSRTGSVVLA